ncbi:hypothetical protein I9X18_01225 [Campylobacter jejuni]|nr:hypothetical protein [Campylobacter jejuni]MBX1269872.1 hypothetical protein [Campylobacter jejuni]MBX1279454.1 hypothetical protein [Campylobacter jejuni]
MEKYIISNREDSNGSRFLGMLNAFYIAKKLKCNFLFTWTNTLKQIALDNMNKTIDKGFENQKIISTNFDLKEDIFDKNFLKKYCIEQNIIPKDIFSDYKTPLNSFEQFQKIFQNTPYSYFEIPFYMRYSWKDIDLNDYLIKCKQIWENEIIFNDKYKKIIHDAKEKAKILKNFCALHLRNGDTVYSYANFRKFNTATTYHATPYELAIEIIKNESKKQTVIIFTDDINSAEIMLDYLKLDNVFLANNFRDFNSMSSTEMFIYDVTLMSYSTKIYGSYSAVTRLASAISGHGSHINIHDLLNERQKYNILKKYYHCLDIHRDQKAYSSFYTYLSGLKTGIKLKKLQNYLEDALKLDLDNDKYRIYLVDCLMKQGKIQEAENYLKNIIKERNKEFMELLLPSDKESAFSKLLINYHINNLKKYPLIYNIFLQSMNKMPFYFTKKKNKILLGKFLRYTPLRRFF